MKSRIELHHHGLLIACLLFALVTAGDLAAQTAFVVNSTADLPDIDPGDGVCDTGRKIPRDGGQPDEVECTLRAAIMEANALLRPDSITFDIPTIDSGYDAGTGLWTITPSGAGLPVVIDPLVIVGPTGALESPLIVVDGSAAADSADGLVFRSPGTAFAPPRSSASEATDTINRLQNLQIGNFRNAVIVETDSTRIFNCRIGTTVLGAVMPNSGAGILVRNVSGVVVGGATGTPGLSPGNAIAASASGIIVRADQGLAAKHTLIQGNVIGRVTGDTLLANTGHGIEVIDADSTTIGGDDVTLRNVIASNEGDGVFVRGSGITRVAIQGNYIGTDGAVRLPNENGVHLEDVSHGTVGGRTSVPGVPPGNVISGNVQTGVLIDGALAGQDSIQGNIIGLDSAGAVAVGECLPGVIQQIGVSVQDATGVVVGGTTSAGRNVISANELIGVELGGVTQDSKVIGNYIGLTIDGQDYPSLACGDIGGEVGVWVGNNTGPNLVGDLTDEPGLAPGNVISGHRVRVDASSRPVDETGHAVVLHGAQAQVIGNLIGPAADGSAIGFNNVARNDDFTGNANSGIFVPGPSNTIGGSDSRARNAIGVNWNNASDVASAGIRLQDVFAQDIDVVGNYIGLDVTGTSERPNEIGIELRRAFGNFIGGTVLNAGTAPGNVISGNARGILITTAVPDFDSPGNLIQGNIIGLDASGNLLQGLDYKGNRDFGVGIVNSSGNIVGGRAAGAANIISGNEGHGVLIDGGKSQENVVEGNVFGTGLVGTETLPNDDDGIHIGTGVFDNRIGGEVVEAANLVTHHADAGVMLDGSHANLIAGNRFIDNPIAIRLNAADDMVMGNYFSGNDLGMMGPGSAAFQANEVTQNGAGFGAAGIQLDGARREVSGNTFADNLGDGIRLQNGSVSPVVANNITNNQGSGLVNNDAAVTVNAQGNWWGDPSGPGGAGGGSGDEVSANVDFANWRSDTVAVVTAAAPETLYVPEGDTRTTYTFFRNWENAADSLDVRVSDDLGWLVSSDSFAVGLAADLGVGSPVTLTVPAAAGARSMVRITATSRAAPSLAATDSFLVSSYMPLLREIDILPDSAIVEPGGLVQFVSRGFDQFRREMRVTPIWTATGGTVIAGLYTAGNKEGKFKVFAEDPVTGLIAEAFVSIEGPPRLELAVGVLQNSYLTQFVDIFLVTNQTIDPASLVFEVDSQSVAIALVDTSRNVWLSDYEIQGSGVIQIHASATSSLGGPASITTSFNAQFLRAGGGGVVRSPDNTFRVRIPFGAVKEPGYVLVIPATVATGSPEAVGMDVGRAATPDRGTVAAFSVSPGGLLEKESVTVEFDYLAIGIPQDIEPARLYIEHVGLGALKSTVDEGDGVIRATTHELGEFRLMVGEQPVSGVADHRFVRLYQNYPNPFNPSTTIRYEVQTRQRLEISVYDVGGRLVARLFDGEVPAGMGRVTWNGTSQNGDVVASGVYFVRLKTQQNMATRKVILIK